jgi:hypothetical protein
LLGESKYYRAKLDPNDYDNLIIIESESSDPKLGKGDSRVIFEDPKIADDAINNDKIGVYWDYLKPDGTGLDDGVIRVIGRYWKQDTTYKIKLHAVLRANGRTGTIEIEVKKPSKLGDTHNTVTDVFGRTNINLDELIIKFSGEYGIPPQIIKGQMQKESSPFTPAWRYEPFQDIKIQRDKNLTKKYFGKNMPFVVDNTSVSHPMGSGDMPTSHSNEDPNPYLPMPIKMSTYTVAHWFDVYVQRHTDKPDIILLGKTFSKHWLDLYMEIKNNKSTKISDADARTKAHDIFKQEIQDKASDIGKSFDRIAQTRKVTSYGLTQMMYITAADNRFDYDHYRCRNRSATHYVNQNDEQIYPEKLNEQDFLLPCYCDLLWKSLNFTFNTCIPDGNWQGGFETKWEKALIKYHGGDITDTYGKSVLTNSQNFKPSNQ